MYLSLVEVKSSQVTQSCPTLCDPMDCSPPGSSVHGIFQARVLEWVAISFSRRSSRPRNRTQVSQTVSNASLSEPPRKSWCLIMVSLNLVMSLSLVTAAAKSLHSCPTPSDPMDYSSPGSSVHQIFQVRALEWVATAFSVSLDMMI